MRASHRTNICEAVAVDGLLPDCALALAWDEQVANVHNLYAMYQSRAWISCAHDRSLPAANVLVSNSGGVGGRVIAPLAFETVRLRFHASRHLKFSLPIECVEILGGQPLGKLSYAECVELIETIWHKYPGIEGVYFKSVRDDSELWQVLAEQDWRLGRAPVYKLDGDRAFHYLALPTTFEAYLGEFGKKQRYNLKRQVRVLSEAFGETLAVSAITRPDQVSALVADVQKVTEKSWKAEQLAHAAPEIVANPDALAEIAAKGLLRAYVLKVRNEPCAYVIGYQFNHIYHYANIGYDASLSKYSPGNVLLFLVIQDLIENVGARVMNFGVTDAEYKRIFGNRHIKDAALLVLRSGLGNAVKLRMHSAFAAMRNFGRDVLRPRRARVLASDAQ
jgi:CelD/BcsL family acetyltransferase involved in cellulose biosynthesis